MKAIRKVLVECGDFNFPAKIFPLVEEKSLPPRIAVHKDCQKEKVRNVEERLFCPNCEKEIEKPKREDYCPHKDCGKRIDKIEKKIFCPSCENQLKETEIEEVYLTDQKGVWLSKKELKELDELLPDSKKIKISGFRPSKSVSSLYFEKNYCLVPDKKGELSYQMLLEGLKNTDLVAIGDASIKKGCRVLLRPENLMIILTTFFCHDEISLPEIPAREVETGLVSLMNKWLRTATEEFDPKKDCRDVHREVFQDLIAAKLAKEEVVSIAKPEALPEEITAITASLQRSIEEEMKKLGAKKREKGSKKE